MQPQLIVTIQPHGAKFDPPARLTLPNTDAHPPLAEIEMYSYDHDLEEFVTIGLGTVSRDGSTVTSNPGSGVIKAGWHCGSAPGGSGCCKIAGDQCDDHCNDRVDDENCSLGRCEIVPDREAEEQIPDNCKRELCSGSEVDTSDCDSSVEGQTCFACREGDNCRAPNEKECCKAYVESSESKGATVCCDGAVITCVYDDNVDTYTDDGRSQILQCIQEHEDVHKNTQGLWCDSERCEGEIPFPGATSENECEGYGVELTCLNRELSDCSGTDEQILYCQGTIRAGIGRVESRLDHFKCG
jgi:hypothetical protein